MGRSVAQGGASGSMTFGPTPLDLESTSEQESEKRMENNGLPVGTSVPSTSWSQVSLLPMPSEAADSFLPPAPEWGNILRKLTQAKEEARVPSNPPMKGNPYQDHLTAIAAGNPPPMVPFLASGEDRDTAAASSQAAVDAISRAVEERAPNQSGGMMVASGAGGEPPPPGGPLAPETPSAFGSAGGGCGN